MRSAAPSGWPADKFKKSNTMTTKAAKFDSVRKKLTAWAAGQAVKLEAGYFSAERVQNFVTRRHKRIDKHIIAAAKKDITGEAVCAAGYLDLRLAKSQ